MNTDDTEFVKIALQIEPRERLHQRIEQRLDGMIADGFEAEMHRLRERPQLTRESTAMRSVGYRQFWSYLEGDYSKEEARNRSLYATRQLAKRQLTWLRSETEIYSLDPLEAGAYATIYSYLAQQLA